MTMRSGRADGACRMAMVACAPSRACRPAVRRTGPPSDELHRPRPRTHPGGRGLRPVHRAHRAGDARRPDGSGVRSGTGRCPRSVAGSTACRWSTSCPDPGPPRPPSWPNGSAPDRRPARRRPSVETAPSGWSIGPPRPSPKANSRSRSSPGPRPSDRPGPGGRQGCPQNQVGPSSPGSGGRATTSPASVRRKPPSGSSRPCTSTPCSRAWWRRGPGTTAPSTVGPWGSCWHPSPKWPRPTPTRGFARPARPRPSPRRPPTTASWSSSTPRG